MTSNDANEESKLEKQEECAIQDETKDMNVTNSSNEKGPGPALQSEPPNTPTKPNTTSRQTGQSIPLGLAPNSKKKMMILGGCVLLLVTGLAVGLGVGLSSSSGDDNNDNGPAFGDGEGWCGDGTVGNGTCQNELCCSYYGWCGFTSDHCVNGQVPPPEEELYSPTRFCGNGWPGNGTCQNSTLCCSDEGMCEYGYFACGGWPDNRTRGRPCGQGEVGDGKCEDETSCCSEWGYCGTTEDHCAPWSTDETGTRALRGHSFLEQEH